MRKCIVKIVFVSALILWSMCGFAEGSSVTTTTAPSPSVAKIPAFPQLSKTCQTALTTIKTCSEAHCQHLIDGYKNCRHSCKSQACYQQCDKQYGPEGTKCIEANCMDVITSAKTACQADRNKAEQSAKSKK